MIILKILKGDPEPEDWLHIGEMLKEGFTSGIDQPPGINWTVEWEPSSNLKEEA